jgi:hypothetical protein
MPIRSRLPLLACILAVATAVVALGDATDDHAKAPHKTVVLGNESIVPSSLAMAASDVLVLQNMSFHPYQITFVEPADIQTKVRCRMIQEPVSQRPPWGVMDFQDGRLQGIIPPGRFASVCSFQPGHYAYTVKPLDAEPGPSVGSDLLDKGQIDVQ